MVLEEIKNLILTQSKGAPVQGEGWKKHSIIGLETKKGILNAVILRKGKYKDVVYTYGDKVSFGDEAKGENPYQCSFTFDIVYNPTEYDLTKDRKFQNIMGEILMDILKSGKVKDDQASKS